MLDFDEAVFALEHLDSEGRKALRLVAKVLAEVYRGEVGPGPSDPDVLRRYLSALSDRADEVAALRRRLDDVLDAREQAELDRDRQIRDLRRELEHANESARLAAELAERQRERAEKAELERDHAKAKVAWMRAHGLGG